MQHLALFVGSMMFLAFGEPQGVEPRVNALVPFTKALRDRQPADAVAAVYRVGDHHLVWLGAKHATRTESLTFRLIADAYREFEFDTVIVEGCPTSWGLNPERLIDYARAGASDVKDGFQKRGETVPAVLGALEEGADLICGEPEDKDLKIRVFQEGITPEDLLGFYTLRSIPQWIREQQIQDAADPAIDELLAKEIQKNRERLGIGSAIFPTPNEWRAWYRKINGKPLGADFTTEEAGPRADGQFGSNRIGAAISRARAVYLHQLVISHLGAGETVLVLFGASHLMIHRSALDAALGAACYVGDALEKGIERC